jgi:hypothetical protein
MSEKLQIRESKRYPFRAQVEIRWFDSALQCHFVRGISHDISVFGLGLTVLGQVPPDQELTVVVNGTKVCGGAFLRHSQPCESGFRIGLYFKLTLFMQDIPEADDLLYPSYASGASERPSLVPALFRRFTCRLWRVLASRATPALPQSDAVNRSPATRH